MAAPDTVRVEFTKDELLVCLRALTSIHEFDPKRGDARNAFTKMIRAGQQAKDAQAEGRLMPTPISQLKREAIAEIASISAAHDAILNQMALEHAQGRVGDVPIKAPETPRKSAA